MSWHRFAYLCRRAEAEARGAESIATAMASAERGEGASLYGKELKPGSWPAHLRERLPELATKEQGLSALAIYGGLGFLGEQGAASRIAGRMAYLAVLSVAFLLLVLYFQFLLWPRIPEDMLSGAPVLSPIASVFSAYGVLIVGLLIVALLVAIIAGRCLRAAARLDRLDPHSGAFRYLTSPRVRRGYARAAALLAYPLGDAEHEGVAQHLQSAQAAGMKLAPEIHALLRVEIAEITAAAEKQMRWLSVAFGILLVLALFLFLASAYAPIFVIGGMV